MFESKYGKLLTVILIIVIIAIVGLLAFLGYEWYKKNYLTNEAEGFVEDFVGEVNQENTDPIQADGELSDVERADLGGSGDTAKLKTYKGFVVLGTMEIPKIDFKYPVLAKVTTGSLDVAVAVVYGVGLNKPGNTVIMGHNYRNGQFFSNNKKLEINDKIYITDNTGTKLTYSITQKFQAEETDTSFYQRDTGGVPEVTLSTCLDNPADGRLIIEARAEV